MAKTANCPFCKIVAGQIPATIILSTGDAIAFLDISPLADGHTLLVPKDHYRTLGEMSPEAAQALTQHLPALTAAIISATGAAGVNVLQNNGPAAGQVVDHVHFHLIPRVEGDGLGFRWNTKTYPPGRVESLRDTIRATLAG